MSSCGGRRVFVAQEALQLAADRGAQAARNADVDRHVALKEDVNPLGPWCRAYMHLGKWESGAEATHGDATQLHTRRSLRDHTKGYWIKRGKDRAT